MSEWLAAHRSYQFRNIPWVVVFPGSREATNRDTLGPEAADAVRQIGTNALPSLIAWMNAPTNSWKMKVAAAVQKLPRKIRPAKLPNWVDPSRDQERASLAYVGFEILGPKSAPAAAEIGRIASGPRTLGSGGAVNVLAKIGKPAVPELIRLLNTSATRHNAVLALGSMGPDAAESVPFIAVCLKQSDERMACSAAGALGRIGRRSEIAVPALIESLADSRTAVRVAAIKALGEFGYDAAPAVPSLRDLSIQPDIQIAREAEKALLKIDDTVLGPRA